MKNLLWILIIICTLSISSFAQITANFTADTTEACGSASVTFTNNSTPDTGVTYLWDFGNGHNSVLKNPVTAYIHPGIYTVRLIVSDGINSDTLVKSNYISIWNLPVAAIGISENLSGCAPLNSQFNDFTIPGDGIITNWEWDFGDGNLSNEQNPLHSYQFQNNYAVSLTVIDEHGCSDIGFSDSLISVYKPQASFLSDYASSCTSDLEVNFYNNSEGTGDLSYLWNFGDGTTSNERHPVHTYNTNGNYNVNLIVTDTYACTDTLLKENYIHVAGVSSSFLLNKDTFCLGDESIFTNTSENAYYFLWDFGDGSSSKQKNPTHIYTQPGIYTIHLTATHAAGCSDETDTTVFVENITADFNVSDPFSCELPVIVHYTNTSQNAVSYEWHFGNGAISFEENPDVSFIKKGIYSDTLIAYSANGCRAEKIADSSMTIILPSAYFTPNQWVDPYGLKGCAPLTVNFHDQSNYSTSYDNILSYHWDFGDNGSSDEKDPIHVFNDVGKYLVSFYFVTSEGCVSSSYFGEVKVGTHQTADFYKELPDTICASQPVQFFDNSQDTALVNEWYWRFGDGSYSMKQNPMHLYTDTGYMNVKLQAYYNGCGVAEMKENFIYIKGPVADITYNVKCDKPYDVLLKGKLIDAEKFFWDFGDGSPIDSVNLNPIHTYPENTFYNVKLSAVNNTTLCSYSSDDNIIIKDIKADFNTDTTYGCENLNINLNSEKSQDVFYFNYGNTNAIYYWDFGDGTHSHTNYSKIKHTYKKKGIYPLKLLVKDFRGCADTLEQTIKIYKPEPEFETESLTGCMPMNVKFKNKSQSDTLITSWIWNFGDETNSNEENPSHNYNQFGLFDVFLRAIDTLGCIGDLTKINYIEAMRPIPDFRANDPTICFGDTVGFIPLDTSKIASYFWDFGDGITSSEQYPKHVYTEEGYYPVSLTLTDEQACDSTRIINNYIYMQNIPEPGFSSSDSTADCYPLGVNFEDTTNNSNIVDWYWNFGDGESSSHLKFPEHIYTAPGYYTVNLNVTTSNGCRGEIIKPDYVDIKGPYAEINAPDTTCRNEDITFIAAEKRDVFEMQWIFGDGATASTDTAVHAYDNIGYIHPILLLKSDAAGTCDIYLEDSIYIPQLIPDINVPDNQFFGCIPFQFNTYNNSPDADNWYWNFGDGTYSTNSSTIHTYNTSGIYNVKLIIENNFGCKDSSELSIETYDLPPVSALNDTLICRGDEIKLKAEGAESYEWFPKIWLTENDVNEPISKPDSTITYTVSGIDLHGCNNTSSVTVNVQQEPKVYLSDTAVVIGEQVILDAFANDIASYEWFPNYNINCTNCPEVTVNPEESTIYEVSVKDTSNCFNITYNVNIDILKKYTLDVPNAFTPDGDGINDILYVRGWGIEDLVIFKIFNRYGEMVFETNDKNIGWNGTFRGKNQGVETYTYLVTVKTYENKFITKRGTVKLLK